MTTQEIIQGLIERDDQTVSLVFWSDQRDASCRKLLLKLLVEFRFIPPEEYYKALVSDIYAIMMNLDTKQDDRMGDAHQLKSIKNPERFFGWVQTVASHHLESLRSKGGKNVSLLSDSGVLNPLIQKEKLIDDEYREIPAREMLERMLRMMKNAKHKQAIRMLIIEKMSPEDVAKALGQTRATIDQWKSRGVKELSVIANQFKNEYYA